jgi:hypothetical protein
MLRGDERDGRQGRLGGGSPFLRPPGRFFLGLKQLKALTCTAAVLVFVGGASDGVNEVIVGALEEPQCREEMGRAIRALFLRAGDGWVPLSSAESARDVRLDRVDWTVAFEGQNVGSIKSLDPGFQAEFAWTFPRDRLLTVAPGKKPPAMANPDARFAGWCSTPKQRPLAVVSSPNFRDPEAWKPFSPPPGLKATLFPPFKAQAGVAFVCPPGGPNPVEMPYGPDDLVLGPSYQDRGGRKLVSVGLEPRRNSCEAPNEPAWAQHLFLLGDSVRYVGANLSLVGAGDYDADGHSELLFWYNGYDNDGYTLFFDDFTKHAEYHWIYH